MTRRSILLASAFASAAAPAASKKPAGAPKVEDRVATQFTAISTEIPVPASSKRGTRSELAMKLDELPVNGSIGLLNKTKAQISSQLSKINNADANMRQKTDANGQPVMKQGEPVKDANGITIGHGPATPEMERVKEYVAHAVDPKNDPDKAQVRIFRIR